MAEYEDPYKPIADYGLIGNLRAAALVGRDGSVDWCCLPDLDEASIFAAILDARRGGRFRIGPPRAVRGEQRYLAETNVLETCFDTPQGEFRVTDFMPVRGSLTGTEGAEVEPVLYRLVECTAGRPEVDIEFSPRFDFARAETRLRRIDGALEAIGGDDGSRGRLVLHGVPTGDIVDEEFGPALRTRLRMSKGDRMAIAMRYGRPDVPVTLQELTVALEQTVDAWRGWVDGIDTPVRTSFSERWEPHVTRSGLLLKLLTHRHTGAIAAAPTTSLPEEIGGVRNWDYRYSWIRDAAFTSQALMAIGHRTEALDFIRWVHGATKTQAESNFHLQIMYGLHGETDLPEIELPHLEGYRGSRPVRIGNAAASQQQLDIYGELLGSAYELLRLGGEIDEELWGFLRRVADAAASSWQEPGHGIWEIRSAPRHYVFSKVMVWVALDRAVRMVEQHGLSGDADRWRSTRDAIRAEVLERGYDAEVGAFVQSFGSKELDAANLLIPLYEFLPFHDKRVQGTIDATLKHLTRNGIVYRYCSPDALPGTEGAFGLCTFWMVMALAMSRRMDEAHELFGAMAARANHLGLYSEEFDPASGEFLGNFPQAFSHIGFINAALYLSHAEGRSQPGPAPVGSGEHREETGHSPARTP